MSSTVIGSPLVKDVPSGTFADARSATSVTVPWEVWCGVVATTSATVGFEWDVSWHRSIGRDGFWTPAHMMVYFAAVLMGFVCSYLVIASTFGKSQSRRDRAINVFGMYAPLGCFVAAWGALAALVSAPFDNWWHDAYGVDVTLLSPPHTLLLSGLRLIDFGNLMLIVSAMNRATPGSAGYKTLQRMLLFFGGMMVTGQMLLLTQHVQQDVLHTATAYKFLGVGILILFGMISQASRFRWATTTVASVFMLLRLAELWIFPLVHTVPRLGPVVNPVNHLVPGQFPVLLIVPAFFLDLLWQHTEKVKLWITAILSSIVFMVTLVPVEWPFATFLASKKAENYFFGTLYFDYLARVSDRDHHFSFVKTGWPLWHGLIMAVLIASFTAWIGLQLGRWLRTLER